MKDFNLYLQLLNIGTKVETMFKQDKEFRKRVFSAQFKILLMLYENKGISPSFIVEELQIAKSNVASMCKQLEEKGFVEHTVDDNDHRIIYYSLTKSGEKYINTELKKVGGLLDNNLGEDEQKSLQEYLQKSLEIIKKIGEEKDVGNN